MSGSWADHAIWWHVYPLGFVGAEREALPADAPVAHRLPRLGNWLDYLIELGCNGLALGPVFAAETHGYDTVDHFSIDRRLGDESDLTRLIEQATARGVRVLLDGVFNHVGRSFFAFADVQANGARSPYASWFVPAGDGYRVFEGHEPLVTLDHTEPAVADYVTSVLTYWMDRGVDGWRLDAAYSMPVEFWRTVTDRVRSRFPEAWFSGEVIHGDYTALVERGGLDTVTQYELWKAIWSSLNDRNFHELAWTLGRHGELLDVFAPQTFVGNHDVTRLASRLDDEAHLAHALVLLCTTGGIPSVYAGDEQAFRGVKEEREGGDDAVRPEFPEQPADLSGDGWPHYRLHQRLLALRRRNPWLLRAHTTVSRLTDTTLVYTSAAGGDELAVALNIGEDEVELPLPEGDWHLAEGTGEPVSGGVRLAQFGWAIAQR